MKTNEQMRQILRDACKKAGSQRAFAAANDVSAQFVGAVLNGDRSMTPELGKALGYEKTRFWIKK